MLFNSSNRPTEGADSDESVARMHPVFILFYTIPDVMTTLKSNADKISCRLGYKNQILRAGEGLSIDNARSFEFPIDMVCYDRIVCEEHARSPPRVFRIVSMSFIRNGIYERHLEH